MEATLSSSAVTPSSQSRPILDTLESCSGATIHIIDSAFVMSAPPVVDLAQVPGLEGLCWRSRTVVDNQGAITVGAAYIDKLRIYPMMLGLLDGRFPDMPGTTFLLRPAANITLLVPNPDSVSSMLQQLGGCLLYDGGRPEGSECVVCGLMLGVGRRCWSVAQAEAGVAPCCPQIGPPTTKHLRRDGAGL